MHRFRRPRIARLLSALGLLGMLALAPTADARFEGPSMAQAHLHDGPRGGGGGRRAFVREQRQQQFATQRAQRAERAAMQREQGPQRLPEAPQAAPAPQPPPRSFDNERPGRLSPEERRALRQQINDAGRDLYRPGRP